MVSKDEYRRSRIEEVVTLVPEGVDNYKQLLIPGSVVPFLRG